jgi:hypothetical protein
MTDDEKKQWDLMHLLLYWAADQYGIKHTLEFPEAMKNRPKGVQLHMEVVGDDVYLSATEEVKN